MSDNEIKRFLTIQSHERFAKLFIDNCTSKILVFNEDEVYIYNNEFKYYQLASSATLIMNIISKVLHEITERWQVKFEEEQKSIMNTDIDADDKKLKIDRIRETIKQNNTAIKNIETTTFIKNVIIQVITILTLSPEQISALNTLPNYINFRNGKLNLKDLQFSERTPDDFITEYLDYDYSPDVNVKIQNKIKTVFKQICNNRDEDYNFILSHLGYCITSETKEQKYLNAYGASASNGKSTIIKIMEAVFNIYVFKADKRLFSESFGKSHKYFSGMKNKRIVYIEELDKKKTDGDLLKDIVDGNKMNNEVLFGTTEKIDISFKLMFFSNNIMNFDADSGIKRRMIAMEFNSIFAEAEDLAEKRATYPNSDVFQIDRNLLDMFKQNVEYKNAFMHLIIAESRAYFKNGLVIPESYKKATNDLCDENDKMKQFIENQFEITKRDEDRITKDEFHELYSAHTKCNFAWTSILSDIKRLGLNYDGGKRAVYKGITIRGVLIGIKKKSLDPFKETSDLDIQDAKDAEIKALKKEIEELKKRLVVSSLDANIEDEPEPAEIIISPEQYIINELKKQQEWITDLQKEMKQRKKKKKQDPKVFELFLDDLDNLCN
jgi:phage/plasmid-associated DNA primase